LSDFIVMLLLTGGSGACILVGGLAASVERIRPRWLESELRHSVIAFGGGVLLSAVALVLVPEGNEYVASSWLASAMLLAGGATFCVIEAMLAKRRSERPQFSAMLLDYLPESLALGGMFATGSPAAPLLALLIGLQNLPEGFNAFRELAAAKPAGNKSTLLRMALVIPLGPLFGTLGWLYGARSPVLLGSIMLFSGGGILYLLFQDIAPQARLERHWAPTLGAVLGFSLGMLGDLLVTVH
jgi:ZIP family zinc transporter